MGLGKKLGQLNSNINNQIQNALQPLSVGGYNSNNILSLPVAQPLGNEEKNTIRALEVEAQNDYSLHSTQTNLNNLTKPYIPKGPEYPHEEISSLIVEKMWRIICLKGLYSFYTQAQLQDLVKRACRHDYKTLQTQWGIPTLDMMTDLAILGLYDIIIFADDSGSMALREPKEDNMSRFDLMKNVIGTIGFWSTLMDPDGIVVRFFNSNVEANGIAVSSDVIKFFDSTKPNGGTPLGKNLKSKIFETIILPVAQTNQLARPVLIITVTDGVPDSQSDVTNTICQIKNYFSGTKYGPNGASFSFAQIGSDLGATEYLDSLDMDPQVGNIIDCTSEFSIEQKQCGEGFTEAVWVIKLMIGSIDPAYDLADEQSQTQTQSTDSFVLPVAQAYPINNPNPRSIFGFGL